MLDDALLEHYKRHFSHCWRSFTVYGRSVQRQGFETVRIQAVPLGFPPQETV